MDLPRSLYRITAAFFDRQTASDDETLSDEEIDILVTQLIEAYDRLRTEDRRDVLIPADSAFLKKTAIGKEVLLDGAEEYFFRYNWPLDEFDGPRQEYELKEGEQYDRIGGEEGRYLSPLKEDGSPESYLARALPYYIPEAQITDSPSYHCYTIRKPYAGDADQPVLRGIVANAFRKTEPRDGGGIQVLLPKPIEELKGVF